MIGWEHPSLALLWAYAAMWRMTSKVQENVIYSLLCAEDFVERLG